MKQENQGGQRREERLSVCFFLAAALVLGVSIFGLIKLARGETRTAAVTTAETAAAAENNTVYENLTDQGDLDLAESDLDVQQALLTVNPYSRPGTALTEVKYVVIHYTANPGATGWENRDYFNNLAQTHERYASSHFIIGLDGTIIQCIPMNEISYASNERNVDSLSIECCHPTKSGKFTEKTYAALVRLTAWIVKEYNLDRDHVIRHYDVTGKNCPKYYVKHKDAWNQFKDDVFAATD